MEFLYRKPGGSFRELLTKPIKSGLRVDIQMTRDDTRMYNQIKESKWKGSMPIENYRILPESGKIRVQLTNAGYHTLHDLDVYENLKRKFSK